MDLLRWATGIATEFKPCSYLVPYYRHNLSPVPSLSTMSSLQAESLFAVGGKVVLVTGGSRGIGKMVSTACARKVQSLIFPDCLCFRQKWCNCESANSWCGIYQTDGGGSGILGLHLCAFCQGLRRVCGTTFCPRSWHVHIHPCGCFQAFRGGTSGGRT